MMVNITNYQVDSNLNHNEMSLHTWQMAIIKRQEIINADKDVEKEKP